MDRLLDMDQLPKLSPDDTENLNRSITKTESAMKTLQTKAGPGRELHC